MTEDLSGVSDKRAPKWDGIPTNPEQIGWHWLRYKRGGDAAPWCWTDEDGAPGEFIWATDDDSDPDDMAKQFDYIAPCPFPEAINDGQ